MTPALLQAVAGVAVGCVFGNILYAWYSGQWDNVLDHLLFQFSTLAALLVTVWLQ